MVAAAPERMSSNDLLSFEYVEVSSDPQVMIPAAFVSKTEVPEHESNRSNWIEPFFTARPFPNVDVAVVPVKFK